MSLPGDLYFDERSVETRFFCPELDPVTLKERGNIYFKTERNLKAIAAYTKSICMAPPGSKDRGIAYANRGAVLFKLSFCEECIEDCKNALKNDYPEKLKFKLYFRMAACHNALGRKDQAEACFKDALKIGFSATDKNEPLDFLRLPKNAKIRVAHYREPPSLAHCKIPSPLGGLSPEIVFEEGDAGKPSSFKAKEKFETGDTLLIEEPTLYGMVSYAATRADMRIWTNCHNCLKMCVNMKPCTSCSWECYCSVKCQHEAWKKYHKFECGLKQFVLSEAFKDTGMECPNKMANADLAIKLLAFFGLQNCIDALEENGQLSENADVRIKDIFKHGTLQNYRYIRYPLESLVLAIMAQAVYPSDSTSSFKLFNFLNKILPILMPRLNHADELVPFPYIDQWVAEAQYFAYGFYPKISTISHSCEPNAACFFYGRKAAVRALRPIPPGEEITVAHLDVWAKIMDLQDRRSQLLKFRNLDCKCLACVGDWESLFIEVAREELRIEHPDPRIPLFVNFMENIADDIIEGTKVVLPALTLLRNEQLCKKILSVYDDLKINRGDHIYAQVYHMMQMFLMAEVKKIEVTENLKIKGAFPFVSARAYRTNIY
ncbi:N-lysine methyltransferase SMYD2-like [Neocloeon triangulifer]|uniref:N-lysine methyltransferase SMYD2-like n=1 Tax=Neocloeon triangulifer TaxID=2078957 RepID=UPI00286F5079|nr:N-lysine methyltransferase SMYD2-like [Neocloeon triangulifer]